MAEQAASMKAQAHTVLDVRPELEQGGEPFVSMMEAASTIRMQLMPQFQTDIPDPLCHHLPALLPPGRMTAPTIWIDLLILV